MQAYREGATEKDVLDKVKQIKKSHRVPMLLEQQPKQAYSRNRRRILAGILSWRERMKVKRLCLTRKNLLDSTSPH